MQILKSFFAAALLAAVSGQASAGPGQQDWLMHTWSPMYTEYSAWGPGQQDWLIHTWSPMYAKNSAWGSG
ncbi:MAG: hypothetical protein OXK20_02260 [Deltaproteobacteria bacterium]|nr:hypothetical protein [Deltaproteobacteria bacterium]